MSKKPFVDIQLKYAFDKSKLGQEAKTFLNNKKTLSNNTYKMYRWATNIFLEHYDECVNLTLKELKEGLTLKEPDVLKKIEDMKSSIFNNIVKIERKREELYEGEISYRYILSRMKTFLLFYGFDGNTLKSVLGKTRVEQRDFEPLTVNDLKKIVKTIENNPTKFNVERDKTIILFSFWSGLRATELLSLKIGDVEFGEETGKVVGKGREKKHKFHIFPQGLSVLKTFLRDRMENKDEYLFKDFVVRGEINYYRLWLLITKISEMSGVGFTMHKLRHSIATWMIQNGYSVRELQKFLRHKSESMVLRYIDVGKDELTKKIQTTDVKI
jgi:integrase